jgi:ABC-2 type transport system ATP-binding protein
MNDIPVLQTHNLGKRFRTRWAVRSLNLTVERGDVFGFLGPNGAGKSTTIRMLLSLIRPTEGSVTLFGKPLTKARADVLQRVGGLVERADFYLYLSARKNLEIVGALRGGTTGREIDEVLDIVGLLDRARDRVKTYSHGMKQRLGIAQALLGGPEFIVLDEPTTGLDPQGIKEVRELIQRLREERGMTVFLSSHLLSEIEQTATSMAIINRGVLVVQGKVKDLLDEQERVVRFDAEPTERAREILAALPFVRDLKRDGELLECTIPREKIADTNRMLVQGGVDVRALQPKRSLEEFFLAITEGASDISSHRRRPPGREDTA